MAVSLTRRPVRDRIVREAEGYLDLLQAGGDKWEPSLAVRDTLAERTLDTLLRLNDEDRHDPHVLYLQGLAYRTMQRYGEAVVPLEEAAELSPDDIHVWLALGWCYKRLSRLPDAIESLNSALAAEPTEAIIHYNLACYWSLLDQPELAAEHLANSFVLDPHYRNLVATEHDFDPIRHHPAFREVTSVIV